jgi:hypothetical protein
MDVMDGRSSTGMVYTGVAMVPVDATRVVGVGGTGTVEREPELLTIGAEGWATGIDDLEGREGVGSSNVVYGSWALPEPP